MKQARLRSSAIGLVSAIILASAGTTACGSDGTAGAYVQHGWRVEPTIGTETGAWTISGAAI